MLLPLPLWRKPIRYLLRLPGVATYSLRYQSPSVSTTKLAFVFWSWGKKAYSICSITKPVEVASIVSSLARAPAILSLRVIASVPAKVFCAAAMPSIATTVAAPATAPHSQSATTSPPTSIYFFALTSAASGMFLFCCSARRRVSYSRCSHCCF